MDAFTVKKDVADMVVIAVSPSLIVKAVGVSKIGALLPKLKLQ